MAGAGALGAEAVGMGGCAWLRWPMAGLWCASSARLRCARTLWAVAERPPGSDLFTAKCFGARRRARRAGPPSADGERQSLYFAHAMCTDRGLVAGVARARLPYAASVVSGVDAAGCARGAGPGTVRNSARLRRYSLDKVGRINPPLECSVCSHELPMCVRRPMRMGMCVCARVRRQYLFV